MARPNAIIVMQQSAQLCGTFELSFDNPHPREKEGLNQEVIQVRPLLRRQFHVYLEIQMQSKHDRLIRSYCKTINVHDRGSHGSQITHRPDMKPLNLFGPNEFYWNRARTAADIAMKHMVRRWRNLPANGQAVGQPVFNQEDRVDASVQSVIQSDGYRYEVSYWYQVQNIYVLFHCYPG